MEVNGMKEEIARAAHFSLNRFRFFFFPFYRTDVGHRERNKSDNKKQSTKWMFFLYVFVMVAMMNVFVAYWRFFFSSLSNDFQFIFLCLHCCAEIFLMVVDESAKKKTAIFSSTHSFAAI